MNITATVVIDGERTRVTTKPIDLLKWEQGTKRRLTEGMGMSDMLRIIYTAAKRQGLTDRPFEAWAESLDDFEAESPDVDPTQRDQPTG